jgi:hypothetical protein
VIRFEYFLVELLAILLFMGIGGFFLYDCLSHPEQVSELIGGSVLLVIGGVFAYLEIRVFCRQLQSDPRQ